MQIVKRLKNKVREDACFSYPVLSYILIFQILLLSFCFCYKLDLKPLIIVFLNFLFNSSEQRFTTQLSFVTNWFPIIYVGALESQVS